MRKMPLLATAAIAGLGAIVLFAAPGYAAGDQTAPKAGTPVQLAHMMGQGQQGQGRMGHGQRGQGMMGSRGMMGYGAGGSGMMGHQGMMGRSMMGPKTGWGPSFGDRVVAVKDLTSDDVSHFLLHRLEMHGNKRLMLGDIKQDGNDKIIAEIVTVDGSLVQRLEINRHTGKMKHIE